MGLESTTKVIKDAADKGARVVEASIKKAWSILDAATEKRLPSEYISEEGIKKIQGRITG